MRDGVLELPALRGIGELSVVKEIAGLDEIAMLGELLDRISAIEENPFIAVYVGDLGFARRRRAEAGIVGEDITFAVELGNLDDVRAQCSVLDREV